MDVKIVKACEDCYDFYHGSDYIGWANYGFGRKNNKKQFFFQQSEAHSVNEHLLMGVVTILGELNAIRNATPECITTIEEIAEMRKKENRKK